MKDAVDVVPGRIAGTLAAPPSKSCTHRAFLLAAQAINGCTVENALLSGDTLATLRNLEALGARPTLQAGNVQFAPATLRPATEVLDCGNSGTSLRLLAATAARLPVPCTLTGDASLRSRPNAALLSALTQLGVQCRSNGGTAPLSLRGPLRSGTVRISGSAGSQTATALLLALPFVAGPSQIAIEAPVLSRPYLDVTSKAAAQAGLVIEQELPDASRFRIPGGQQVTATRLAIEGDWSSAAFPLAAAALTGGSVTVTGLHADSPQGDRRILSILRAFGAEASISGKSATCRAAPLASPGTVDVSETPDLFPILCVLAAGSQGTTDILGAASLRTKESNRIAAMAEGLRKMGINVVERPDGVRIKGGKMQSAEISARGDHRIHMAFVVAAIAAQGTSRIADAGCVAASFPGFHAAMTGLGAGFVQSREVAA